MKHVNKLCVLVLLTLELYFGEVQSVTLQFCKGQLYPKLTNQSNHDSFTHVIGISRFDFIDNSTYCNGTHGNGTFPFPTMHHQCRVDETTVGVVFRRLSYQQEANISSVPFQCPFNVFLLEIDWVPLKGIDTTLTLDNLTSLCGTKNTSGLNRINIPNNLYDHNGTIIANQANCTCKIILLDTTKVILHTYDNRLISNQQMTLRYKNGSYVKTWEQQSDFTHLVETEAVTVEPQALYLHWNNKAITDGGHFWISIEAVNSSMHFICGANVTAGFTSMGTTIQSIEPTTENIELTTENTKAPTPESTETLTTSDSQAYTHDVSQHISTRDSSEMVSGGISQSTTATLASGADIESNDRSNIGLIVGIVIGILVLLLLLILIACCVRWYITKRNRTVPTEDKSNNPKGQDKQTPDAHDNDIDTGTKSRNNGLFPPITKDYLSNPVNSKFSNVSHNRQSTAKSVEECHEEHVDDVNCEDKGVEQETEIYGEMTDQNNPEKKRKKKKKRKKHRKQETMDYLLGEDEQSNATPVDD